MTKLGYCLLVLLVFVVAEDSSLEDTDVANIAASGEILHHSVVKRDARKKKRGQKMGKRGGGNVKRSKGTKRMKTPQNKRKVSGNGNKRANKRANRKKRKGKKGGKRYSVKEKGSK